LALHILYLPGQLCSPYPSRNGKGEAGKRWEHPAHTQWHAIQATGADSIKRDCTVRACSFVYQGDGNDDTSATLAHNHLAACQ